VQRKGEISSWGNEDFVKTVRNTGKKTFVIAGGWTSVCVAFPALQAKADGYKVCAVMDASGNRSEMASRTTLARLAQGGVIPVSKNAVFVSCNALGIGRTLRILPPCKRPTLRTIKP